ncbi:MAG: SpoIID/LytB domain-containing protein, partial [bacterium]
MLSHAPGVALAVLAGCAAPRGRPVAVPRRAPVLRVALPERPARLAAAKRRYRGKIEHAREGGRGILVNVVALDDYVRGVVPGEVSPAWPPEALKAFAVVARSYAWAEWSRHGGEAALSADTRDQKYCGRTCEDRRSDQAVDETRGLVLAYRGRSFIPYHHSDCGGGPRTCELSGGGRPCLRWAASPAVGAPGRLTSDRGRSNCPRSSSR